MPEVRRRRSSSVIRAPRELTRRVVPLLVDAVALRQNEAFGHLDEGSEFAEVLLHQAEVHGVQGWLQRALDDHGVQSPSVRSLVSAAVGRHQRAVAALEAADDSLGAAGIPFLAVKGPVLVATLFAHPEMRSYVDLDLVVDPLDAAGAVDALECGGYALIDVNWPLLTGLGVHEVRLQSRTGAVVDLHWSLGQGPGGEDASPPVSWLMARSREVSVGPRRVRTLSPADTLVHLALHAADSGGHRLGWLADLRAALPAALQDAGAQGVLRTAQDWQARPALAVMLARTARTLGTALPTELAQPLQRPAWSRLAALVDVASPPQLSQPAGSASRLIARSCRASGRRSILAFTMKSRAWLRSDRQGTPTGAWLNDPANEHSALRPVGGPEGARDFFAEVVARAQARSDGIRSGRQ